MRAETFANAKVVEFVNKTFVPVWYNHSPDEQNSGNLAQYTPAQKKVYPEGGGRGNLRMFFVDSDGTILSEIQGYWSVERFMVEAKWSLELTKDNRKKMHGDRAKALRKESAKIAKDNPDEMRKPIAQSSFRKEMAALNLLASWHDYSRSQNFQPIVTFLTQVRQWQRQRGIIK